jgi:hypothetical protein
MGDTGELGHTPPDVSRYTIFVLIIKGSGTGSGSVPLLMDPDPGGPKHTDGLPDTVYFLDMDSDPVIKF